MDRTNYNVKQAENETPEKVCNNLVESNHNEG